MLGLGWQAAQSCKVFFWPLGRISSQTDCCFIHILDRSLSSSELGGSLVGIQGDESLGNHTRSCFCWDFYVFFDSVTQGIPCQEPLGHTHWAFASCSCCSSWFQGDRNRFARDMQRGRQRVDPPGYLASFYLKKGRQVHLWWQQQIPLMQILSLQLYNYCCTNPCVMLQNSWLSNH